jgi:hypothetical protein
MPVDDPSESHSLSQGDQNAMDLGITMHLAMKRILLGALLSSFLLGASAAAQGISSLAIGLHDANEKALLGPAFIGAVNGYLRRYEPKLVLRNPEFVKMQVDYDYLYDIELTINAEDYEIRVTLAQDVIREGKAQKLAAHLSSGVHKAMEKSLIRGTRARDKTDRNGLR